MTTQQLLELLRTWPQFEGRLDWLEQYPPDTPIMDALKDAPHGGSDLDRQFLRRLEVVVMLRLSPEQGKCFTEATRKATRVFDLSREEYEKTWDAAIKQAWHERYVSTHIALLKYLEDTNGLFEAALEVLYNEHKDFQRALDFVSDNLLKHSSEGGEG